MKLKPVDTLPDLIDGILPEGGYRGPVSLREFFAMYPVYEPADRNFQREQMSVVLEYKQSMISTIFTDGLSLPELTIARWKKMVNSKWFAALDGQQRSLILKAFFDNKFKTEKSLMINIDGMIYDIGDKYFNQLDKEVREYFLNYCIYVNFVINATPKICQENFIRLNKQSRALNSQEKRNAIYSDTTIIIRDIARPLNPTKGLKMFAWQIQTVGSKAGFNMYEHTKLSYHNMEGDSYIAAMCVLMEHGYDYPISNKAMDNFYLVNTDGKIAKKTVDFLKKQIDGLVVSTQGKKYKGRNYWTTDKLIMLGRFIMFLASKNEWVYKPRIFIDKWMSRDKELRLLTADHIALGFPISPYDLAFKSQKKKDINFCLEELYNICYNKGIISRDPIRDFPDDMLFRALDKQDGNCDGCGCELSHEDEIHAGHIDAHIHGGETVEANCVALCSSCNISEGSATHKPFSRVA